MTLDYDTDDGLPDARGCFALVAALWKQVHDDLRYTTNRECLRTVRWVGSPDFDFWCAISGTDPAAVRAHLEREHPRAFALYRRVSA